jgi:hypothetical protein
MKQTYKRRNYFIKKTLQGRFIFQFYLLVVAGALIFSFIFSYMTFDTLTMTYENYNLKLDRTPFMLLKQILTTQWLIFLPVGLIVIIAAILQTHRLAGPLYKIEMILDEMTKGIIDQNLFLRKNDDAKEIVAKLNLYNRSLVTKITSMKELTAVIDKKLLEQIEAADPPSQEKILEIQAAVKNLTTILNDFTIKN